VTTTTLQADGFLFWAKFNRKSKPELMESLPLAYGVYVVRKSSPIKRVHGESDIIYVGSACNQNGLKGRIRQYFSPGPTQPTNKRILALVAESDEYELGWCRMPLKSDALGLEQRILERYLTDHGERPPENKKG